LEEKGPLDGFALVPSQLSEEFTFNNFTKLRILNHSPRQAGLRCLLALCFQRMVLQWLAGVQQRVRAKGFVFCYQRDAVAWTAKNSKGFFL